MKKQRSIIAGILLVFAFGIAHAQNDSNAIKKLAQSIRSHKNLEVSFTYQTLGDNSDSEEAKKGIAYFQDGAYKVIMEDQHAISDGKTTWHYIVEEEEVMVGQATDDDNPYTVLDDLERDGSGVTQVLDKKGELKQLEIEVDEGVKLLLNITELKFDQDFPKGFFAFDEKAYPDVEIIDMR